METKNSRDMQSQTPTPQYESFQPNGTVVISEKKSLESVVIPGKKLQGDALEQYILAHFNVEKSTSLSLSDESGSSKKQKPHTDFIDYTSIFPSEIVKKGEVMLVELNQEPHLVPCSGRDGVILNWIGLPGNRTRKVGVYKLTEPFYGDCGRFVLNVPQGQIAKAWSGTTPLLFGEGTHVIEDSLFKFSNKNADAKKGDDTGLIELAKSPYIKHGNIHILYVPPGRVGLVKVNNKPHILESRDEPYIYDTPLFELVPFEYKNEQQQSVQMQFPSASEKCIIHGSLKRLIPPTGEVAITHQKGKLKIISEPQIIDDPTWEVTGFLNTQVRDLRLPSKEHIEKRKHQVGIAAAEAPYDVYTTQDQQRMGVKLIVVFKIINPEKALTEFGNEHKLLKYIEDVAQADMRTVMNAYTADQLTSTGRVNVKMNAEIDSETKQEDSKDAAPPPILSFISPKDHAIALLSKDLEKFGMELQIFNIEESVNFTTGNTEQMQRQFAETQKVTADAAIADKRFAVEQSKARQEAEVKRIAQEQLNAAVKSKAEADFEAEVKRAEAQAKSRSIIAQARAAEITIVAEAESKANEQLGAALEKSPALLQLRLAQQYMEALKGASVTMVSDPLMAAGFGTFAPRNPGSLASFPMGLHSPARQIDSTVTADSKATMRATT